jgi:hypothetical protein
MPGPPSHRIRRSDPPPTMEMPVVAGRRGRHSANGGGVLSPIWFAVGGAAAAVLLGLVVAFAALGGSDDPGTPIVIGTAAPSDEALLPTDTVPSESLTPSPDASPSSSRSPQRTQDPAVLLARLKSTVNHLAAGKQLDRNSAKELSRRLREAEAALADGDRARAWNEVTGFASRLAVLRDQDKISSAGYQDLAAIVSQLAQVLPRR